jgi:KDEL-tailed cysteine endopeptidase
MNNFCTAMAFLGVNMCDNSTAITTKAEQTFIEHLAAHGLSYGTQEEYKFRLNIFATKDAEYAMINADPANTFTVGHNQFSTFTKDEFKKLLGARTESKNAIHILDERDLVTTVDWRTKGAVNPVKNQGQCGSCWAFGAVACVEAAHFLKTGDLLSISEQEVVDCDRTSAGCSGGW